MGLEALGRVTDACEAIEPHRFAAEPSQASGLAAWRLPFR